MKRNREGYLNDGVNRECVKCGIIFKRTAEWGAMCHACNSDRVKNQPSEKKMLARAKSRAKVRNLDFDLDVTDIIIPEFCPVLGIPLVEYRGGSGGKPNSPALDRIDNSKGYVKGNVMVLSHLANCMKSSATNAELHKFANWILVNISAE